MTVSIIECLHVYACMCTYMRAVCGGLLGPANWPRGALKLSIAWEKQGIRDWVIAELIMITISLCSQGVGWLPKTELNWRSRNRTMVAHHTSEFRVVFLGGLSGGSPGCKLCLSLSSIISHSLTISELQFARHITRHYQPWSIINHY